MDTEREMQNGECRTGNIHVQNGLKGRHVEVKYEVNTRLFLEGKWKWKRKCNRGEGGVERWSADVSCAYHMIPHVTSG